MHSKKKKKKKMNTFNPCRKLYVAGVFTLVEISSIYIAL